MALANPEREARLPRTTPCSVGETRPETRLLAVGCTNAAPMARSKAEPTINVALSEGRVLARGITMIAAAVKAIPERFTPYSPQRFTIVPISPTCTAVRVTPMTTKTPLV